MTARPNLLFLMTDHQRADSIGMVQAGQPVTPALNRLAAGAARYTRAYSTSPICVPARTALATGLYPTRNGVVFNDWAGLRAGDHTPLHQLLAEAGYAVGHVGVEHIRLAPSLRDRVPFDPWVVFGDHADYLAEQGIEDKPGPGNPFSRVVTDLRDGEEFRTGYSSPHTAEWPWPAEHFRDPWFARQAEAFVRRPHDRPWALFLYLWSPHPPLRVPEPYWSMFPPDQLDLPGDVGELPEGEPEDRARSVPRQLSEGVDEAGWRRVWSAHLGLTRLADDALGSVLDALDETGQTAGTVTLFTVDHGDHLGQRRLYQKFECYEAALRIPLLIRAPGIAPGRYDEPVSHLDVMPTVLELLGMDCPDGLDGRSLAGAARAGTEPEPRPVYAQYSGNPAVGMIRRAVIRGPWKYVYDGTGDAELFNVVEDPLERHNRAGDQPGLVRELHQVAADWAATHGDWVEF